MGTPLGYPDFDDGRTAPQARFPFPIIDGKVILRFACGAIGFAVPVDAGPFMLDAAVEGIADGPVKAFDLGFGEGVGAA